MHGIEVVYRNSTHLEKSIKHYCLEFFLVQVDVDALQVEATTAVLLGGYKPSPIVHYDDPRIYRRLKRVRVVVYRSLREDERPPLISTPQEVAELKAKARPAVAAAWRKAKSHAKKTGKRPPSFIHVLNRIFSEGKPNHE